MDIKINELSAKTFNWLGMNESVVKDVPEFECGSMVVTTPDDVIPGFVFKTKLFTPESLISSSISLPMPLVSLSMPESAILSTSSLHM